MLNPDSRVLRCLQRGRVQRRRGFQYLTEALCVDLEELEGWGGVKGVTLLWARHTSRKTVKREERWVKTELFRWL